MVVTPLGDLLSKNPFTAAAAAATKTTTTRAEQFINAWNANRISDALDLVDDGIEFEDTIFAGPFVGKEELERTLRLMAEIPGRDKIVVDDVVVAQGSQKVGLLFHTETSTGSFGKKGTAYFNVDQDSGLIRKVFLTKESSKSGEANLTLLRRATEFSELLGSKDAKKEDTKDNDKTSTTHTASSPPPSRSPPNPLDWLLVKPTTTSEPSSSLTLPEQYFAAWNERDMTKAVALFSNDCEYDDTAFPAPFRGKEALENHLRLCANCFPPTFQFCVDDLVIGNDDKVLVRWHVENEGKELFFTRGCSFYNLQNGKIAKGVDIVEPAVFKVGSLQLTSQSVVSKLQAEPIRFIPLVTWFLYMYVVFFSDWFYGLPATALEQRTWEEVRDLSLNFFLVSPILNLPFAPVVHPMLEGVFNLLLSWAALFAGFLSDDRPKKPNLLPMLPMVAGMQFLTSAFLLPYLVTRSTERDDDDFVVVYQEDLTPVARVTESRLLAPFLTLVGSGSILWGILARGDTFGGWNERLTSFLELLSIDRVGSSFLVDLAIFAAFQGWFVDDDAKRRGMATSSPLVTAAKYVPFFGMAAYLTFRDSLPTREES